MVRFTKHALAQMRDRAIRVDWVLDVIATAEHDRPVRGGLLALYGKPVAGRTWLKVIVTEDRSVVVTVHFDKGFRG